MQAVRGGRCLMAQKSKRLLYSFRTKTTSSLVQSGIRQAHSTETALLRVNNDILMTADEGFLCLLIFLDLSAPFDTVNIPLECLWDTTGLSGQALSWFHSYQTCVTSWV
ncbi:hypothetical protein DPEC_G00075560 [Dallia pectoralis]|uniref:Uncharacterized protein n=1 Tax=Dallia pectoralis TaxID=75939 RepID=A0ACC2H382_DALPE|nr:hypothetical protein DPEC_G00075560 [Dallia pectoralis]